MSSRVTAACWIASTTPSPTGNPSDDEDLYARAEDKLSEAAEQSDLKAKAETNTTELMTELLTDAGFDQVTVVYDVRIEPGHAA